MLAPTSAMRVRIESVCRYLEDHAAETVTLTRLGQVARMSPYHLQRTFKTVVGVSPRQYGEALRVSALKSGLRAGSPVTDAIYAAGFGSASRVYERASSHLGMTPGRYRLGGRGVEISYATAATQLGTLLVAATDRGICAVTLGAGPVELQRALAAEFPHAKIAPGPIATTPDLARWMRALAAHLDRHSPLPDLPLDIQGTSFQTLVWSYLRQIPRGETRSYAELARALGRPRAARAVASACARNRIALLIPCHRVIRGSGALGGYRWGLARKRALLDQEAVPAPRAP
jgi:AraC family transcriptional regulator, regulatory protein of adaptative response / methylated-DNA-[protein]-cysteine methyltransferase